MATYFGEVVEPVSRAFWDADDDFENGLENLSPETKFEVSFNDTGVSYENKLFILVHGPLTTGFAETCLLSDAVVVAEVNNRAAEATAVTETRDYEEELITKRKPLRPTKLYALKESVVLCVCSPDLEVAQAYSFIESISRWLVKSENVIALTCEFKTSHLTDEVDLPSAFLRGLSSDYYKGPKLSESLEQPNMIGGTPAALLTYCQIFKIPAVMCVVYTDSFIADSITAQPLVQLFSKLHINLLRKETPVFKKRLYYGAEAESNLYM